MSFLFEQALRRKCDENPDLSMLQAHWEYDRRLVADALQIIGRTFPHYSRHDVSHSKTILVQLARILGPARVDALSATDLWLLLEAAYQHDIGMVITDTQAKEWLAAPDFKGHLERLRHGEDRELAKAAVLIKGGDFNKESSHWPLDVRRALTLVLADFGRKDHAPNAERIVRDPVGTIGLLSPRTPLIPDRLFKVLGAICAHHGRSFEDTMRLPFRESGVGTDIAHPRFVACMLRLGDLLDLDNGRFCPVMTSSFGPLPPSSAVHVEKHASILHLDIGMERIDVEAECGTYESYEVTEQWLEWLRGELKNQMAHWVEIVPAAEFGALPSLGKISARERGFMALEPGRRPRFEVDREAIITLVRGANLYDEPFSAMRELLQNAVDATILRLWREKWSRRPRTELEEKLEPKDLRKALKGWPICVRIVRRKSKKKDAKVRWHIAIQDRGTGIDFDEIQYLQRIGGSSKNERRRREIDDMPEWMRPSGIFGIGLQSVFMFTSKVVLTTRHHETHRVYRIVLQNGEGPGTDGLSIQMLQREEAARVGVGTKVEFKLEVDRIPKSFGWTDSHTELGRSISRFDVLVDNELPIAALKLKGAAQGFAEICVSPIKITFSDSTAALQVPQADPGQGLVFDRQTCILIRSLRANLQSWESVQMSYRGAPVGETKLHFDYLDVACDAYFGRANKILQMSREALTNDGRSVLRNRLREAIKRYMPTYLANLRDTTAGVEDGLPLEELVAASLAARAIDCDPCVYGDEWGGMHIPGEDGGMILREIALQDQIIFESIIRESSEISHYTPRVLSRKDCTIEFRGYEPKSSIANAVRDSHAVSYDGTVARGKDKDVEIYRFTRIRPEVLGILDALPTADALRQVLSKLAVSFGCRATIPCPRRHGTLSYKRDAYLWLTTAVVDFVWPRMLCPFTIDDENRVTLRHLAKYVEWTAKNAEGGSRDEREVAQALRAFLEEADDLMKDEWKNKRAYDLSVARYELARWLK
jgi:hypothetical protein